MSGTITPTMLTAATGLMNNQGLTVSPALLRTLSDFGNSTITKKYSDLITTMGANVGLITITGWLSGQDPIVGNVTANILATSASIIPDVKKFISNMQSAAAFSGTSFSWSAAISESSGRSPDSFGLGVSKPSDLATGGVGKLLANVAGYPPTSTKLSKLSVSLRNLGTAFDPSVVADMFTPAGFIRNLKKQGLGNVGGLSDKLRQDGLDPDNLLGSDSDRIVQSLVTIQGEDLQKVITQTNSTLPNSALVSNLSHYLDASRVLPIDVVTDLPGGTLLGLGNALVNIGGSYKTLGDLAASLSSIEVGTFGNLDAAPMGGAIPSSVTSVLKPMLGVGGGPFGNPTILDIIGTAGGHKHTEAFSTINNAHSRVLALPIGTSLMSAATALIANPTWANLQAAFNSNVSTLLTNTPELESVVTGANAAFISSTTHLTTERTNLTAAGISLAAAVTPGATQVMAFANKLHDMGVDKQQLGYSTLLTAMANVDVYGDAIRATMVEGRNIARNAASGIPSTTKIDPQAVLKKLQS